MTRKVQRVPYQLHAHGIRNLPEAEIRAILRGADELIMRGGRSLLVKILKGSRSKDVLSQSLDHSPVYGQFKHLPAAEVLARVDWVILNGYLTIEYDHRLPLLIYTEKGWVIERETYADELLRELNKVLTAGQESIDMSHLKDKNRQVIWLLPAEKVDEAKQAVMQDILRVRPIYALQGPPGVFPAVGMAVYATNAKRVTDDMFIEAAHAVADQVTPEQLKLGMLFPPQSNILETEIKTAARVARMVFETNLAGVARPDDCEEFIRCHVYKAEYRNFV